jgi:hypothetical protein
MKFWDASAVPLLLAEPSSLRLRRRHGPIRGRGLRGTDVECASRSRGGCASSLAEAGAGGLRSAGTPVADGRRQSRRRGRAGPAACWVHPLRSADALQLAAAVVSRRRPSTLEFVTLDERQKPPPGSRVPVVD